MTPCAQCGGALSAELFGACPRCLLRGCEAKTPAVEGYELSEELGRGGMGVVYRARELAGDREVALKVIRGGELATDEAHERFLAEMALARRLNHDAIVRIYETGEHADQPWFAMQLIGGGTLAEHLDRFRGYEAAARLVATIARAVDYGHQQGVLHRDLKPANILLDGDRPYVADFGTARVEGRDRAATASGVILGTPEYMSPEQALGRSSLVTSATDVYSLGAILYQLLTGRPPFEGESGAAVIHKVVRDEPIRPRRLDRRIPPALETICLTCLEKEPQHRYASAASLADDLERFLRREPLAPRPSGLASHVWRACRRHPVLATSLVAVVSALAAVASAAVSVAAEQEAEIRRDVLLMNAYAARLMASAVCGHYRTLGDRVVKAAADPDVRSLVGRPDAAAELEVGPIFTRHGAQSTFDNIDLWSSELAPIHRWPPAKAFKETPPLKFRDYFVGALRLAEQRRAGFHVSKGYFSRSDSRSKFALSAPLLDANENVVGVLTAGIGSDRTIADFPFGDPHDRRHTTVLAVPRDRQGELEVQEPRPGELVAMFHEGIAHGAGHPMFSAKLNEASASCDSSAPGEVDECTLPSRGLFVDEHHRDPVPGFEGEWLAGFAPVGCTGHVVIVQTRRADVASAFWQKLAIWASGAVLAVVLLIAAASLVDRRARAT